MHVAPLSLAMLSILLRPSTSFRSPSFERLLSKLSGLKGKQNYYLMKSEPSEYSIDNLIEQNHPEHWDGVRNYEARNIMRGMEVGDSAFFYHSNCKPEPGWCAQIAGGERKGIRLAAAGLLLFQCPVPSL